MSVLSDITHFAMTLVVERPAANKSLSDLIAGLQKTGDEIQQRLTAVPNTDKNHRVLTHIMGIEKWGQRRLKVVLGEPFVRDEYDVHRPLDAPWDTLQEQFRATRADTIAIAQHIARSGNTNALILHNQFGDMSVKGWLRYLTLHAFLESKKMR